MGNENAWRQTMRVILRALALFALLLSLPCALGVNSWAGEAKEMKTCPLCGTRFEFEERSPGPMIDRRLDLKPLGTGVPVRLPPECPSCHFVLYEERIPAEELEVCRRVVAGEEYKAVADRVSYRRLGLLYEALGRDDLTIANIYLGASWQEEADHARYLVPVRKCGSGGKGDVLWNHDLLT
jgi:hypothetical protein